MDGMGRILFAALLCVSVIAFAAPPRRGPPAIGSSKEEEPCPSSPGTAGPDLALLRGVSWAFEPTPPEIRTQAIEDLGFLGDARALNPLAALTLDPNAAIARAAVRAVATIRHPRAEEILANLVRHPSAPLPTKQYALSLIPFQNTATALRFVHATARLPNGPFELLNQAREMTAYIPSPSADQALPPLPQVSPPEGALVPTTFPGEEK